MQVTREPCPVAFMVRFYPFQKEVTWATWYKPLWPSILLVDYNTDPIWSYCHSICHPHTKTAFITRVQLVTAPFGGEFPCLCPRAPFGRRKGPLATRASWRSMQVEWQRWAFWNPIIWKIIKAPPKKKCFLMEKLGDPLLLEDVYNSFLWKPCRKTVFFKFWGETCRW